MILSLRKVSFLIICILILSIAACSKEKKEVKPAFDFGKYNIAEITKFVNLIDPIDNSRPVDKVVGKSADHYAGIGKTITKTLVKDVYMVHAGLDHVFNLTVTKPTVIITSAGGNNTFKVTKQPPFDGEIIFITKYGKRNHYEGGKVFTVEEFRQLTKQ